MARTAVITGVGPGLGASLARKLVREGCRVGLFARSADFLNTLAAELNHDKTRSKTPRYYGGSLALLTPLLCPIPCIIYPCT